MALLLPNNFKGLLAPLVDDFKNDEERQTLLKGDLESLSKQGLTTQAAAASRLYGENQLLGYALESAFGTAVEKAAKTKKMRQQLDTQARAIELFKDKIGKKDEAYLNALASPLFAARPEATTMEVVEVAADIINYSQNCSSAKSCSNIQKKV